MIDIQAKLQAGKGAGYAHFATIYNLKNAAETLVFLQEQGIAGYGVLKEKAAAATAKFNELTAKIKAAEKRMTAGLKRFTPLTIKPVTARNSAPSMKPRSLFIRRLRSFLTNRG